VTKFEPEGVTRFKQEGVTKCEEEGEEGKDQGQGKSKVNDEEPDKNHLMNFVLQLESIADEDDKTHIERLWKKQLNCISMLKDTQIDSNDTDNENEDDTDSENEDDTDNENENEDTFDRATKNKNRIKKIIEEFDERGNNYFKHCNKEKIETISTWCNELLNKQSEIFKNKENLNKAKKTLTPVRSNIRKLADSNYPISKQRKLLQEVPVGKGVMGVMETVVLPYIKQVLKGN
jgi:vacuolar-type H+-ATPase subunit I/STV1